MKEVSTKCQFIEQRNEFFLVNDEHQPLSFSTVFGSEGIRQKIHQAILRHAPAGKSVKVELGRTHRDMGKSSSSVTQYSFRYLYCSGSALSGLARGHCYNANGSLAPRARLTFQSFQSGFSQVLLMSITFNIEAL